MHNDLWTHAVQLYARPGVQESCLQLQSRGTNVCLLLCAAWLAETGVAFSPQRLAALAAIADPWHQQVVTPLRHCWRNWRRWLRPCASYASNGARRRRQTTHWGRCANR